MRIDHPRRRLLGALAAVALCAGAARAGTDAILTVAGEGAPVALSSEAIAALPQHEIATATEFTDGRPVFRGPLARDVLKAPAGATVAVMRAVNDYTVEIPLSDFADYDVVLATHMNGAPLSRRDKGPIWVMYPLDSHAELASPVYVNRLIWQLASVAFK